LSILVFSFLDAFLYFGGKSEACHEREEWVKWGKEVRMREARLDSGRNRRHRSGVQRKGEPFPAWYGSHGNEKQTL